MKIIHISISVPCTKSGLEILLSPTLYWARTRILEETKISLNSARKAPENDIRVASQWEKGQKFFRGYSLLLFFHIPPQNISLNPPLIALSSIGHFVSVRHDESHLFIIILNNIETCFHVVTHYYTIKVEKLFLNYFFLSLTLSHYTVWIPSINGR